MKWLRKLMGLDFPDPEVGQVWRSRHSGRAFRVDNVQASDCGRMWTVTKQHELRGGFNALGMSYTYFPHQWREMLREEGRVLDRSPGIEPDRPWPRHQPPVCAVTLRGGPCDGMVMTATPLTRFYEVPRDGGGSFRYQLARAEADWNSSMK